VTAEKVTQNSDCDSAKTENMARLYHLRSEQDWIGSSRKRQNSEHCNYLAL
jgi:hypothetical protein